MFSSPTLPYLPKQNLKINICITVPIPLLLPIEVFNPKNHFTRLIVLLLTFPTSSLQLLLEELYIRI